VNDYVGTHGLHALIEAYTEARQNFYRLLPTYVHFGEGWRKRADGVAKMAKEISPPSQHT
jgi:lysozyme family protein